MDLHMREVHEQKNVNELIETVLERSNHNDAMYACIALRDRRSQGVMPLIQALKSENPCIKWRAAAALQHIGEPAVEELINAVNENSSDMTPTLWALGQIGDTRSADLFVKALCHEDGINRYIAAEAILKWDEPRVKTILINFKNDDDEYVRSVAEEAIKSFGPK